jgi:CIC family chloride channel protein
VDRRILLHREQRRIQIGRAALVGILSGLVGVGFNAMVQKADHFSHWLAHSFPPILVVLVTGAMGGAAAWSTGKFAPEAGGSGIPHIKAVLLHIRSIRPVQLISVKVCAGLLALAAGMSLGREGPTVQMGAALGKVVGDFLKVPKRSYNSLIAAGAGAGLAAAFNAPLAGFIFVMEELKREMSPITYGTALLASVCSVAVTRIMVGQQPSFTLISPDVPPLLALGPITLFGVVAGLAGVAFNKSVMGLLRLRDRTKCPRWAAGLGVGVLSGLFLVYFPDISGGGHELASDLLAGHFQARHIVFLALAIFVGKLLFTALSYGTGVPGGIFAPILVMGAFLGFAFGTVVHIFIPEVSFSAAGFATIGMAAVLSSSVRAPLTGVVLIVEMTTEYKLLYALLIGSFVAYATAELMGDEPIYEALLERDIHSTTEIHTGDEEPEFIEFLVEPESTMDGRRIKDLDVPDGALITSVVRHQKNLVPRGTTRLKAGDTITAVLDQDNLMISVKIHDMAKAPN